MNYSTKKINILSLLFIFIINNNSFGQCWSKITAGSSHSLIIKNDGTLWAWGGNVYGELGDGTYISKNTPIQIGSDNNWKDVKAGAHHTIAIKNDGSLWSWGRNYSGELGDGTNIDKNTPTQIGTDNNWFKIFSKISGHSLAQKNDGTLWAWGSNNSGQLGDGTNINKNVPILIQTVNIWDKIVPGNYHNVSIKTDGTLWAWGNNTYGQLGNSTNTDSYIPNQIGTDTDWKEVTVGYFHTVAIKNNGTLWAWGSNYTGQLGNGLSGSNFSTNSPTQIGTATNWDKIDSGLQHTIAIKTDGTLWGWGWNYTGQIGNGNLIDQDQPIQVGTLTNWEKISVGDITSFALQNNNTLWAWGANGVGELGDGTNTSSEIPISIDCTTLNITNYIDIVDLKIFPNPASKSISFEIKQSKIEQFKIYDINGRLIIAEIVNNYKHELNISSFGKGIYLVKIFTNKDIITKQIIIN